MYAAAWSAAGAVGSVTATGSETYDPVTYAIASGDEAGLFAIRETTVEITVAGTSVTLTVEAEDEGGGAAVVTVAIAVSATCASRIAAPDPSDNPELVSDRYGNYS